MSTEKGFATWRPQAATQVFVNEVLDVMNGQREYWPLTQRYWLYRLIALKGWLKVDEYSASATQKKHRHLCTPGKNLNLILNRGRRAGLIPWDAVESSRGMVEYPLNRSTPEGLVGLVRQTMESCQFDRQNGQDRAIVLWMETEGMVSLVEDTAHHYGATILAGKGFDVLGRKHDFAEVIAEKGDVLILHCGDLDKSGHTVFQSLEEDLRAFIADMGGNMQLKRIALTEAQALAYELNTTPATSGLNSGNHGRGFTSSVECQLEALDAPDIINIIDGAFTQEMDMQTFNDRLKVEDVYRNEAIKLLKVA